MLGTILLIILIVALLGTVPAWPYSRGWGYGPSGILGLLLVILIVLLMMGILPFAMMSETTTHPISTPTVTHPVVPTTPPAPR